MPPHLLTLPREIRDNILSRVSHPTKVRWLFPNKGFDGAGSPVKYFEGNTLPEIIISDAPCVGLLRSCTRLREEYLEYLEKNALKDLHVTMKFLERLGKAEDVFDPRAVSSHLSQLGHYLSWYRDKMPPLAFASCLTIIHQSDAWMTPREYKYRDLFVRILTAIAPGLTSVKLAHLGSPGNWMNLSMCTEEELFHQPSRFDTLTGAAIALETTCAPLPQAQWLRGECWEVERMFNADSDRGDLQHKIESEEAFQKTECDVYARRRYRPIMAVLLKDDAHEEDYWRLEEAEPILPGLTIHWTEAQNPGVYESERPLRPFPTNFFFSYDAQSPLRFLSGIELELTNDWAESRGGCLAVQIRLLTDFKTTTSGLIVRWHHEKRFMPLLWPYVDDDEA